MGVLSFLGSGVILVFYGIKLFTREDYDPIQPLTVMFVYWIICDMIQAIARMFNFRWVLEGAVREGAYCVVQGMSQSLVPCFCLSHVIYWTTSGSRANW